jgi:hypothetical protein
VDKPRVNDLHPTMKPVELIERAIHNSSRKGDRVLDPFGGSGSTLIACERTGRRAQMLELDPVYVDVMVRRWQECSGKEATLEGDGRSFRELCAERIPSVPRWSRMPKESQKAPEAAREYFKMASAVR